MTDPRDHAQRHGSSEHTPDTGQPEDTEVGQRNSASDLVSDDDEPGPDADQLDVDNAVEADSVETLDPDNPPA